MSSLPDPSYDESNFHEDEDKNKKQQNNNPLQQNNNPPKSEWEKYIDDLSDKRLKEIADLAKLSQYTIDGETYTRKKIKTRHFMELEILRAKFAKEKDEVKATNYLIDVYAKCAEYYLGISREKFGELDWEVTKPILDSCNFRTVRGLPN